MVIIRFGESESLQNSVFWYETESGRVDTTDDKLHEIWMEWVCEEGGSKELISGEIVYTFKEPFKFSPKEP